jgi:Domain of unknown function (DUF5679)
VSAFALAHDEGVLVWEYDNLEAYESACPDIRVAGWVVENVVEKTPPAGAGRVALLNPVAWLRRPSRVEVTLRRRPEAYCLTCGKKRQMDGMQTLVTKRRRKISKGWCPVCGKVLVSLAS